MIEVTIKRPKSDVSEAIVQFAARRGYRLTHPWYIEGLRIEAPSLATTHEERKGFWAAVTAPSAAPRIDVELKSKRRTTRAKVSVSNHPDSIKLAYELQAYLNDDRAYDPECPPMCPNCGSSVPNPIARYCGRCGHRLVSDGGAAGRVLRPPPVVVDENQRDAESHRPQQVNERDTDWNDAFTPQERERFEQEALTSRIGSREDAPGESAESSSRDAVIVEREESRDEVTAERNNETPTPPPISQTANDDAASDDESAEAEPEQSRAAAGDIETDDTCADEEQLVAEAESESEDPAAGDKDSSATDEGEEKSGATPPRRLLAED